MMGEINTASEEESSEEPVEPSIVVADDNKGGYAVANEDDYLGH